jgi:hypothetical protein
MPSPHSSYSRVYECQVCGVKCKSLSGCTRHKNAQHPRVPVPQESKEYTRIYHEHLNGKVFRSEWSHVCLQFFIARPCAADRSFLWHPIPEPTPATPATPMLDNP